MSIILTKVRVPQRRREVLRRARLIDALHQNLHRKLTFISAPAGYGKTTLLVDFASDVSAVVCWYHIGPDDVDLAPFVSHLIAAFQQQYPEFGKSLAEIVSSGEALDAYSMATELINEIEAHVDDFTLLILDDYHLVGEKAAIADLIEALLEHLPDQVRMVIGSRSIYGIPTANLYVREELATLSADELRFRASELQALVSQNYHFKLSDQQATELAQRSDGWVVAIMLAIRTMEHDVLPQFEGATEQVYAFLADEVVNRQSPMVRDFLMATSILDEFNAPMCSYLLEVESIGEALHELEARNLFVTRIETATEVNYRYHQLFSDYLRERLRTTDPERMRALHRRAAEWYKDLAAWELAVPHMLAAGEKEVAARWMDGQAKQIFVTGRQNLLSQWYQVLAEKPDMRVHAPRLVLNWAKTLGNQGEFQLGEQLLDIAEPALRQEGDTDQLVNALITRGMFRRFQEQYADALSLAEEALGLLAQERGKSEKEYRRHQAERLKGIALYYLGEVERAVALLQQAASGFRKLVKASKSTIHSTHDLAATLNDLGTVFVETGNLYEAQICFQEALEIRQRSRSNRGEFAVALNNMAYLQHQVGHYSEAWQTYLQALEVAQMSQWRWAVVGILCGQGDLLCDLKELDKAQKIFNQALNIGKHAEEGVSLSNVYLGLSRLECESKNFSEALNWLRKAAIEKGQALETPEYKVRLGEIYLEMGQLELAIEALTAALESWGSLGQPRREQALAAFYLARALYESGQQEQALRFMEEALKFCAKLGYDQFLVVAGRRAPELLSFAAQQSTQPQLDSLLRRVQDFRTGLPTFDADVEQEQTPEVHLEVLGFGDGQVRCDGVYIANSDWRSTGARALFFLIVDRGEIRKESVGLEFWPDFSPAKISSNFHATLWRVRQALGGPEFILFKDGRYRINPAVTLWYDVAEFESFTRQAQSNTLSDEQRAELWRRAIELYQGQYLDDINMDWAAQRREELRETYLRTLIRLADWHLAGGRFLEARSLYEKSLSIDPYQDQVHLEIMRCLVGAGSPNAARAYFRSYRDMLKDELKTEPQPEILEFYQQLSNDN